MRIERTTRAVSGWVLGAQQELCVALMRDLVRFSDKAVGRPNSLSRTELGVSGDRVEAAVEM